MLGSVLGDLHEAAQGGGYDKSNGKTVYQNPNATLQQHGCKGVGTFRV